MICQFRMGCGGGCFVGGLFVCCFLFACVNDQEAVPVNCGLLELACATTLAHHDSSGFGCLLSDHRAVMVVVFVAITEVTLAPVPSSRLGLL